MYVCGRANVVDAVRGKLEMILDSQQCGTFQDIVDSGRYQEEKFSSVSELLRDYSG